MVNSISVTNKIKIFISSRCGDGFEKYNEVRRELKKLIESTNIANVYLFEEEGASTQSAQQDYLYALDDSDVCIFLIDNADDVTPAIMKEISRAKSHPKKSLYLFCNENKKEPTQIQRELIGATGSKYYTVKDFQDFIKHGYRDLINDICKIYRHYCRNRLVDKEFEGVNNNLEKKISVVSDSLSKHNLKGIDKSKAYLGNIIYPLNLEIEHTTELDDFMEQFLKVIWGEKEIKEFNSGLYLEILKKEQGENLNQIVKLRWHAIQSYWLNDIDKTIKYLNDALKSSKDKLMPDWFIQDILIDLRNIQTLKGRLENKIVYDTVAQLELNNMPQELFYPVIDRYEKNLNKEINKEHRKSKTSSVYSVKLGNNLSNYVDELTNIYVTACYYGSLTHILLMRDRIKDVAFHLCEEYIDWEFRVLLLKLSMITDNSKKIKENISYFNNILGKMNSKDSMEIYNFTNSIPIKTEKIKSRFEVFKHLGYFFNDTDYQLILNELLKEISNWIEKENRAVNLGEPIITSLYENRFRMDPNLIIEICLKIINKEIYYFFDKVFELLESIDLSKVHKEKLQSLTQVLVECVSSEEIRTKSQKLINAIINLKKHENEYTEELNLIVQEKMSERDKKYYFLETTNTKDIHYVKEYIKEIKRNIDLSGKNGSYSFSSYNSYLIIKDILKVNPEIVKFDLISDVIGVCVDSLQAKNLTYLEKISAIQLIVFIKIKFDKLDYDYQNLYRKLMERQDVLLVGFNSLLERHSQFTLEFNIYVFAMVFGETEAVKLIEILSELNKDEFEQIECMKALKNIVNEGFFIKLDYSIQNVLIQFVLGLKKHSNKDIRYLAVSLLIKMITSQNKKTLMTQLSKTMDYENVYIKSLILNSLDDLREVDLDITKLMLKKALVDNHYLVREMANEYSRKKAIYIE
ncbi:hypothetical protein CHCC14821_2331 [Bacillus paralicheniformis]|uniref:hypothetical protein n=1 Tax=Bacillus paralicheniformis TaxID=1648923 RepID=UPI00119E35BF|nr:hypothetical protein [Bacillus paralicheniformis]TWM19781.1 hypothetical protein CHCC14821_2331 [Bacillus paralicheniformis]